MKKIFLYILSLIFAVGITACSTGNNGDEPVPSPTPEPSTKPVMLWVDASANFHRFIKQDSVRFYLDKAKAAGFTDIIVDVRPTSGEVMYKGSRYADEITSWKGEERDASWDYLAYFVQECKACGLKIHAAMNTFTAGQNQMRRGRAYTDPAIAAMVSQLYTNTGIVDLRDDNRGAVFINPCLPEAQEYVLNIAKEIVSKYDVDGIIYDRCRFDNEDADWSDASKAAFAAYVKEHYNRENIKFPSDIYTYDNVTGKKIYGIYQNIWYEWRASVIHDFFFKSKEAIKAIKPNIKFSTYTGAWYSSYYEEGSNWASSSYDPYGEFSWANSSYKNTGFAEALDMHLAGMYYGTIDGSGWWTIAGACSNVKRVNNGACAIISSLAPEKFVGNYTDMKNAINVAMRNSNGLMIFDLYHVKTYNFWDAIKEGIDTAKE